MNKRGSTIIVAIVFTLAIPALGYVYLGPLVSILFLIGYLGGFLLWVLVPANVPYSTIRVPFWATFLAFILLHKVEENITDFFEVLSENITSVPVPEVTPLLIIGLLILPVGAWLITPFLIRRGYDFGYYLAWTLFASMGITELAHFVFPLFTNEPYGYFPGMASVGVLAPLAWWGLLRLSGKTIANCGEVVEE
ncbi:MAG: hypothetical protein UZ17_ACD001002916 [Acidobacteria bacterium OLB17]|nr:MAG: hypothetical protein UZ17_ACD001002916 [Acidobacteria bacterium OLB17]MCZ2391610.1 hypothetical protein [Acidobacteriota bacterium]